MPQDNTVLSKKSIEYLLDTYYDLSMDNAVPIPRGTANCFRIDTKEDVLFLKEYPSWTKAGDVRQEGDLVSYLAQHSFPVSTLIQTVSGDYYCIFEDRIISIQRFIHGKTFSNYDLPDDILMESAELLGRMHVLLHDYDLPVDMSSEWIKGFDLKWQQAKYDILLKELDKYVADEYYHMIREDLLYKRELLTRVEPYGSLFERITYCSSHGDYNSLQFICGDSKIKAVIDFSTAKKLPVVWELARNYMQSSSVDGSFQTEKFRMYLRHYQKYSPLNEFDIHYILHIYLYQLARSQYGYREYLQKKAQNAGALIRFAHWRTEMCRGLERRIAADTNPLLVSTQNS